MHALSYARAESWTWPTVPSSGIGCLAEDTIVDSRAGEEGTEAERESRGSERRGAAHLKSISEKSVRSTAKHQRRAAVQSQSLQAPEVQRLMV